MIEPKSINQIEINLKEKNIKNINLKCKGCINTEECKKGEPHVLFCEKPCIRFKS